MRTFILSHSVVSVSFTLVILMCLLTAHDTSAFKYRTLQINLVGSDRWMDVPRRKMGCNMVPDRLSESAVEGVLHSVFSSEHILQQQQQQLFLLWSSFVPQATVQPYEREPLVW